MASKRIQVELSELAKAQVVPGMYSVEAPDDNLYHLRATLFGPKDSPYAGGTFKLSIFLLHDYPYTPPKVKLDTKIYHPNVSKTGAICLGILKDKWIPTITLDTVLSTIHSLLKDPDPINIIDYQVAGVFNWDRAVFDKTAKKWTEKYAALEPASIPGNTGGVEFVVHTMHNCDMCFQRPILGQRYTSDLSSFDLCAHCFEAYNGPEVELRESVLVDDMKVSPDFVLKLKICSGESVQLRRLKVAEVWDKGCANLSYTKLLSAAARFVVNNRNNNNKNNVLAKAVASYRDEDGDQVTFSSNDEFKDAFLQVLAAYPERKPFLVTITLFIDGEGSELPSGDWYVRARG